MKSKEEGGRGEIWKVKQVKDEIWKKGNWSQGWERERSRRAGVTADRCCGAWMGFSYSAVGVWWADGSGRGAHSILSLRLENFDTARSVSPQTFINIQRGLQRMRSSCSERSGRRPEKTQKSSCLERDGNKNYQSYWRSKSQHDEVTCKDG